MNWRWPTALATAGVVFYAGDSLRHRRDHGSGYELHPGEPSVDQPEFLYAAEALTAAPISQGNEIDLLINGDEIFPAFLETIRGARESLNLLTYVYWKGGIADDVAAALCAKAEEGVEVNVLLDAVGAAKMDRELVDQMQAAGVTVARFRPPRPYAIKRVNHRTHRKVLVADGVVGMIGGVGIADEWTGNAQDPDHWRDTHVRVRGPVVRGLQGAFAENWLEATGDVLVGDAHLPRIDPIDGGGPMQVVRSAAGVGDTNAEALYFLAIACAKQTLDLTAAYFAPRPAFVKALCEAAAVGVAIRILVPGEHMDKPPVRVAGRAVYEQLLECGIRVFEYHPTMLHAKSLCIDGGWAAVGSVNFDNRSFALNDEATLCVQSAPFAELLTAQFERDLEVSHEIDPKRWARRGPTHRGREAAARLVRREL